MPPRKLNPFQRKINGIQGENKEQTKRLPREFFSKLKPEKQPLPSRVIPNPTLNILLTHFENGALKTFQLKQEVSPEQLENFPKHCSKSFFDKNFSKWGNLLRQERDILKEINSMIFRSSFGKKFNPSNRFKICVLGVYGLSGISEFRKQAIEDYLRERGLSDYFEVVNTSFHSPDLKHQIATSQLVFPLMDLPILKKFSEGKFNLSSTDLKRLGKKYRGGINFQEIVQKAGLDKRFFVHLLSKSRTFLEVLSQQVKSMSTRKEDIERTINYVTLRSILAGQGKAFSYEDTKHEKY